MKLKIEKYKKQGIIVLGGHVQALGIVRIFGKNAIPAIVIDKTSKNITKHSIFCKGSYAVDDKELLPFLIQKGQEEVFKDWLLFPTDDFQVRLLSENRDELSKYFIVTTCSWDIIKLFYNKVQTYRLAVSLDIPIAGTFFPQNENDLNEISPVYPCIIKPAEMHDFYSQVKKKVFVCKNFQELINNYKRACSIIPRDEIIVQNIIPGPSRNQFSACFLFLEGKSYVSLIACRMRQHPIDFGNATTYAEAMDIPVIKEYAERILAHANYEGVCEVEFKKDETDGQYKFLEVNTRTWKWHAIAEKANTPFLMNYSKWLNGEKIKPVKVQSHASFRHTLTDIPTQIKLLLKGFDYALRLKKPVVHGVWSWNDIKPWLFEKLYLFYLIRSR